MQPSTQAPAPDSPTPLLGGLTPREFMRDYWQKKPLLIRQAIPGFQAPLTLREVQVLARRNEVESRLVTRTDKGWALRRGPFRRLPPITQPDWTLLVQSVDLHDDDTAALMRQFRFIPDARLDDAMISIASAGGGVGPHYDSYDVFLLQARGRRRWRTSQQADRTLLPDLPLKILANFRPDADDVLEPGDMLYLPPNACHDGVAVDGECMTISIGFRVPSEATLARGLLESAADQISAQHFGNAGLYGEPALGGADLSGLYSDEGAAPAGHPAELPGALVQAALDTLQKIRFDPAVAARFLGQWLTTPPDNAFFDPADDAPALAEALPASGTITLDRCTRMMYFADELFINGEVAPIAAQAELKLLADQRQLESAALQALGAPVRAALDEWLQEGWIHWQT